MSFAITPYGLTKSAYNLDNTIHTQQFSPQMNRRTKFTPAEESALQEGKSRWLPRIFQSYATPATELMSSPGKGALMSGLTATGVGALLGGLSGKPGLGAALGAGVGIPLAAMSYFGRRQRNEDIEELMRRLPAGATKRDVLADPVYQKDLDRKAEARRHNDMVDFMRMQQMDRMHDYRR